VAAAGSLDNSAAVAYALWKVRERGRMFVSPGDPVYEGMIVGIHTRDKRPRRQPDAQA